jgi:hypothetical protein
MWPQASIQRRLAPGHCTHAGPSEEAGRSVYGIRKKRKNFIYGPEDRIHSVLVLDLLSVAHFTLVDAERKAAIGVGADPCLEEHRRTFLTVIRERDENAVVALLTLG